MKTALVLRHVAFEDLGAFEAPLVRADYNIIIVDPAKVDERALLSLPCELLVVLGGPIGAYESDLYPFLNTEHALIEKQLKARTPILGVCLGAQMIAQALGAKIYPMGTKEIGWSQLTLSAAGMASPLRTLEGHPVLHWHGDMFDVPKGAEALAATEVCANQAFRLGANMLGLQFHCEADPLRIEHWLVGHACELAAAKVDIARLRADARRHGAATAAAGGALITEWLAGVRAP